MKTTLRILALAAILISATACSSSARVGTTHHHVAVGGSVQ